MGTREFSGEDIYNVLDNQGTFTQFKTTGDHVILKWFSPEDHDTEELTVVSPLHDSVSSQRTYRPFHGRKMQVSHSRSESCNADGSGWD